MNSGTGKIILILSVVSCVLLLNPINYVQAAVMPAYVRLNPIELIVSAPTDVALDASENVYIVESINNRLLVFSQSGLYKRTLIGLYKPISVAVDNNGMVYIGNKTSGNVEVYTSNLTFSHRLGVGNGEFSQPNSIDIDDNGNIYVVDYVQNNVKVFLPNGSYLYCYGCPAYGSGQFEYPSSIVIDRVTQEVIILDHPLITGPQGQLKGARIQVFQVSGSTWTFLRSFGEYGDQEGQMNKPQGVEVDDAGRLYVTESQYHIVYVYDNNPGPNFGSYLGKITDIDNPMRTPMGIVLGDSNRLFIASLVTGNVEVYGIVPYTNMEISPLSLSFQGQQYGANPPSQVVEIRNIGTEILDWTAQASDSWITLSDTSGSIDVSSVFNLSVGVNIAGLSPNSYAGSVAISSTSGAAEIVNVNLTVLSNPPVAHPGGPYTGVEGQAIILDASNSSGGLVLYQWDINHDFMTDSFEYSSPSPTQSHTYNQEGAYTIKLKVTDQGGASDDTTTTANITDSSPTSDFTASSTGGNAPLTVNFTNQSSGHDQPLTYEWDFDYNGTVDSTVQNPSYTYTNSGTYSVSLKVTDSDGSVDTLIRPNYISVSSSGYTLNIFHGGSGSGTVTSASAGIDCGPDCSETYDYGSVVTLSALPDAGSTFTGWSGGGCSGTGDCVITIYANSNITALFDTCPDLPVRIDGIVPAYYQTLQSAYDAALSGETIQSQAARFTENPDFNLNKTVTLEGGFNCDYSTDTGMTMIDGSMTISNGTVIIKGYSLK